MKFKEIKNNIYYCGLNDVNRKYFDELIPLEHGTSYNSYLVIGSEKTAIIDTTYHPKTEEFFNNLNGNNVTKIDYIIANHGEQDHTGALPEMLKKYPDAIILTNPKCKENIMEMLLVSEDKIRVIADGEEVSLGDKTLKFIYAPWVHWPDTMFTYLKEDNMLFTCDFLGAHYTFDNIYAECDDKLYNGAKRYFAEIMMPFSPMCRKYVQMIREMNPEMLLPSHGPIYKDCKFIVDAYADWASETGKNLVLIPYVSMYNSTKEMVDYLNKKLNQKGIQTALYNVVDGDLGELATALVDATTIVIGAPMVLAGPHPMIVGPAYLINVLRPKAQFISYIGSYGWGGNLFGKLEEFLSNLRCEPIEPLLVKGKPKKEDFEKLDKLAESIYTKHKELNLL